MKLQGKLCREIERIEGTEKFRVDRWLKCEVSDSFKSLNTPPHNAPWCYQSWSVSSSLPTTSSLWLCTSSSSDEMTELCHCKHFKLSHFVSHTLTRLLVNHDDSSPIYWATLCTQYTTFHTYYPTLSHSLYLTHRFYQPTEPMTPHLEKSHIGHKLAVCDPRVWESCAFPTLLYQEAGNQALFKVSS